MKQTNEVKQSQITAQKTHLRANEPMLTRLTGLLGLLALGALYALLPENVTLGPSWLPLALEVAIIVPMTFVHVARHPLSHKRIRLFSIFLLCIVTMALVIGVALMVYLIIAASPQQLRGGVLLRTAIILWTANFIVFGLWYWEIDGGGPYQRYMDGHVATDFMFPQQADGNSRKWAPLFVDYLFVAFTCATALSPTDTYPLSRLAKLLMMIEALIAVTNLVILAGRAVNIL
jgi:Protein of unknown function (DUF1345)